jgi:hypothetical protein
MRALNSEVLEADLRKKTDAAAALLAKTARECEAHEEKDAEGNVTSKGRLMRLSTTRTGSARSSTKRKATAHCASRSTS